MKHRRLQTKITLAAAASFFALGLGSASAADLGGDCCADLEERIAELEATTARKGNRKVSLTVSGWVAEQIIHWDDGVESNTYLAGLGTNYASNVNFSGAAQISPGWSAGFVLHLEAIDNNLYSLDADNPRTPDAGTVNTKKSYWYIKSDQLGQLSVGKQSPVGDNAAFGSDLSGTTAAAYWVSYDAWNFKVNGAGGVPAVTPSGTFVTWGGGAGSSGGQCQGWGGGAADCVGSPRNQVRYDSPTIAGFTARASWGEDDEWGVTGDYTGTWGEFKVRGVASYSETSDSGLGAPPGGSLEYTQLAGYVEHMPSGIWGNFQWGHLDGDGLKANVLGVGVAGDIPSNDVYYAKAGVKLKLFPIGLTTPYGEYLKAEDGVYDNNGVHLAGAEIEHYGGGVVQDIDAAAMQVWLRYRNHQMDIPGVETDDMYTVVFGALIGF